MVKIDLITGFLGAGKTTFLTKYAKYLISLGEKVCILENDFGAINVDMMLISDLDCDREMIAGGCDYDCHLRRFRTKLISMAMRGYTRVIVEPSGVYDTDEFFDTLYDDTLSSLYEIGNIFCVYDINTKNLSYESRYILVSEASCAGKLIVSKRRNKELLDLNYLNSIMKEFNCIRVFKNDDIIYEDEMNYEDLLDSKYHQFDYIKVLSHDDVSFDSFYYFNNKKSLDELLIIKDKLFNNSEYGNVSRIKGFIYDNGWKRINITHDDIDISDNIDGQDVIIVIGENLKNDKIELLFNGD